MFNWFKRRRPGTCQCGHIRTFHTLGKYRCFGVGEDGKQCLCRFCIEVETKPAKLLTWKVG